MITEMSNEIFNDSTMEQVTDLLMKSGCTVNRPAMVKLTQYIAERDRSICDHFITSINRDRKELERQTRTPEDPKS